MICLQEEDVCFQVFRFQLLLNAIFLSSWKLLNIIIVVLEIFFESGQCMTQFIEKQLS